MKDKKSVLWKEIYQMILIINESNKHKSGKKYKNLTMNASLRSFENIMSLADW